jgi:hypothetical protein
MTSARATSRLFSLSDLAPAWMMAVTSRISWWGTGSLPVRTSYRKVFARRNIW